MFGVLEAADLPTAALARHSGGATQPSQSPLRPGLTRRRRRRRRARARRAWKPHLGERALSDHLAWLDGVGYTCFWQGNKGQLAQANGGCWRPNYQSGPDKTGVTHRWSNLVCTARDDLLALFRATSTPMEI